MSTFVERVNALRKEKGISKSKMLKDLKLNANTFVNWEKRGNIPAANVVERIADYLDTTIDYLLNGTIYPKNAEPANPSERREIPFCGDVSAGVGAYADGRILKYIAADEDDMVDGYEYAWLRVDGDSMEPELFEGDLVLVRLQETAETGDMVVALIGECDPVGVVKRIECAENSHIALISSNPAYPPRLFVGERMNEVRIFGKVVSAKRKF